MSYTLMGKKYKLSASSFPFTVTYVDVVSGTPVERFVIEYTDTVVLPNVSQQHGTVRTRIEWPDGSVQETDPPGLRTLPRHDDQMLAFPSEKNARIAFSFCYMEPFYRPFGCSTCGNWHVYLLQWMPVYGGQQTVAINPIPSMGSLKLERLTVNPSGLG